MGRAQTNLVVLLYFPAHSWHIESMKTACSELIRI
jgi:hypothetical protein